MQPAAGKSIGAALVERRHHRFFEQPIKRFGVGRIGRGVVVGFERWKRSPLTGGALCAKGVRPDPSDPTCPRVAAICVYSDMVPAARAALKRIERLMPRSEALERYRNEKTPHRAGADQERYRIARWLDQPLAEKMLQRRERTSPSGGWR